MFPSAADVAQTSIWEYLSSFLNTSACGVATVSRFCTPASILVASPLKDRSQLKMASRGRIH